MADAPTPGELAALRGELEALRDQVAALDRSIADAEGRVRLSMRERIRCPDCGTRRIAHFDSVPDFGYGQVHDAGLAVNDRGMWRGKETAARLEAYACTRCGLVEWWIVDPAVLVDLDDERIEILTSEPPESGPYR